MPAPLKVTLSEHEDLTLRELSLAKTIPKRTRIRAMVLRLNNQGWSVPKISHYFHWAPETVRVALKRWLKQGLVGLWDLPRSGRKPAWKESDWNMVSVSMFSPPPEIGPIGNDRIGLSSIENLGGEKTNDTNVTTGEAVKVMRINGMGMLTSPLYLFAKFFEGKATEHL